MAQTNIPSPSELNYFVEVASTLNISRAAERLGISQPSLSLAIQRLEASFGIPLLLRGKSGVRLTPAGQKLVVQARSLLGEWENIRSVALKDETEISGRFTIGCHVSVALFSLNRFLPHLLQEYPAIEFKLAHDLSRRITEAVVSYKVDFGIVVNPVAHPDLVIRQLFFDEVSLWIGPESCNRDVLVCDAELIQSQSIMKQFASKGFNFKRTITSTSLEVVTSLTAAGAGVGILPRRIATGNKKDGLKPFAKNSPKFHDQICLVYRADTQKSLAARTMANAIVTSLKCETN